MRIYCMRCETANEDTACFCSHCGNPLKGGLPTSAIVAAPVAAPVVQPQTINVTVNGQRARWSRGVAAVLSFVIPGLGQMYKGQIFNGLAWFVLTAIGYVALVIPGIVLHLCCIIGAAMGDPYK